jgi:DNA-binding MarR family transcriptional regulator
MNYGFIANMIGLELRKTQIKAEKKFEQKFGRELLPGHYTVLILIKNNPGATQSAIAASAGLDRSSLVPLLKQYEKRGLIIRKRAINDGRSKVTQITKQGEEFIEKHRPNIEFLEKQVMDELGQDAYLKMIEDLKKLQTIL